MTPPYQYLQTYQPLHCRDSWRVLYLFLCLSFCFSTLAPLIHLPFNYLSSVLPSALQHAALTLFITA